MLRCFKNGPCFRSLALPWLIGLASCNSWGKFWQLPFNAVASGNGAVTGFPASGPFTVDFTAAIDIGSVSANTTIGSATCSGSVQVSLDNFASCLSLKSPTLANNDTRLVITPLPFLKPLTTYKVRVTTALKSNQGVALSSDYTSDTYTTKDFGKWVFTGNFTSANLSYATLNQSTGNVSAFATVANGSLTIPLAMDPGGRVVISSHNTGTSLNYSSINQTTGVPSAGSTYADVTFNRGFVFHPTLSTLYGAGNNSTVTQYSINMNTGAPLSAANLSLPGSSLTGIGIHPTGKYVYVSSNSDDQIYTVQIDQASGSLTSLVGQVATGGASPVTPVIESSGSYLYSANNTPQTMSYYSISQSTGLLTLLGTVSVGNNPQGATIDPTGRFVYIVNTSGPSVSVFSINSANGFPNPVQTLSVANFPTFIAIEASGRFAVVSYGSTTNQVGSYSIDAQTGALTQINLQAATNAQGIAVY